jgi:hypothetical protein
VASWRASSKGYKTGGGNEGGGNEVAYACRRGGEILKTASSPPPIQAFEGRLQRGPSGVCRKTLDFLPAFAGTKGCGNDDTGRATS